MRVIPLNQEPKYVRHHSSTPNLIESTKSSTKNSRRSSRAAAFTWATAMSVTSRTLSCGNVRSSSKISLVSTKAYNQNIHTKFCSLKFIYGPFKHKNSLLITRWLPQQWCRHPTLHLTLWQTQMSDLLHFCVGWLCAGFMGNVYAIDCENCNTSE